MTPVELDPRLGALPVATAGRRPRGTLALLAASAGLGAANLYYAQPLAAKIAEDFHTTASGVSSALVGTQLGYAAGMLLLVPLGDVRERRAVIVTTALAAACALLGFAAAPSLALLAAASAAVGLCASLTQMMVPFAVGLAPPADRGRVVGMVMSGLLTGVLLSRTVSGTLGAVIPWRWVFVAAAGVMVALAAVLRVALPAAAPVDRLPYRALLGSLAAIVRREPVLRRRCAVGALSFASFSMFWSTIAFQVTQGPIHGGSATAGLFGALGVTGILIAPLAGRLAMRVPPVRVNVGALAIAALAFAVFAACPGSLVGIGVGVVLLDAGSQANMLANQTVIFGLAPGERSRINAIYMVSYFLGGAIGTAIAAQAWQRGGWTTVCAAGAGFSLLAMLPLRRG
ncbi:MAG TPA: MFS transporter [Kofleriaceae bacterium]|nr:MFS transporter [Kofleriaceae bacterium]